MEISDLEYSNFIIDTIAIENVERTLADKSLSERDKLENIYSHLKVSKELKEEKKEMYFK